MSEAWFGNTDATWAHRTDQERRQWGPGVVQVGVADDARRVAETRTAAPALELIAYRVGPLTADLVPAARQREWLEASPEGFAKRCLPLVIANEWGWWVTSRHTIRATWGGGEGPASLCVDRLAGEEPCPAHSHFGCGILTWRMPWLFRTPPGWNLWVKGPANWPRDGVAPLEGVVETDWAFATFTMNWQLTRPHVPVVFKAGEPICQIVPQKRGSLEGFQPLVRDIESDSELKGRYLAWSESRLRFNEDLKVPGSAARERKWQRDYYRAVGAAAEAAGHQLKVVLRPFRNE